MYEVSRICASRVLKGRHELYAEWKGYDQSHNGLVLLQILFEDVLTLLTAYEAKPANFKPRLPRPSELPRLKWRTRAWCQPGGECFEARTCFRGGCYSSSRCCESVATRGLSRGSIICCDYTCVVALSFVVNCSVVRAGGVFPCWFL